MLLFVGIIPDQSVKTEQEVQNKNGSRNVFWSLTLVARVSKICVSILINVGSAGIICGYIVVEFGIGICS